MKIDHIVDKVIDAFICMFCTLGILVMLMLSLGLLIEVYRYFAKA